MDFRHKPDDEMPQEYDDLQPSDFITAGQLSILQSILHDLTKYNHTEAANKLQEAISIGSKALATKIISRCPGHKSTKQIAENILEINF